MLSRLIAKPRHNPLFRQTVYAFTQQKYEHQHPGPTIPKQRDDIISEFKLDSKPKVNYHHKI